MNKLVATLIAALAGTAFAAGAPQEAQTSGSEAPKSQAEAIHLARVHGLTKVRQAEAQRPGSEQPQGVAETIHLKRNHGNVNDFADRQMMRDAARL